MRTALVLAALFEASSVIAYRRLPSFVHQGFTVASAGGAEDVVVTEKNILIGAFHDDQEPKETINNYKREDGAPPTMPFEIVNNLSDGPVKAYIVGLCRHCNGEGPDSQDKVVFVTSDGSAFYPSSQGSGVPVEIENSKMAIDIDGRRGDTFTINLPFPIHSGRVYFSVGELKFFMVKTPVGDGLVQPSVTNSQDPSAETNWGFIEFTFTPNGALFANVSFVDFVGMILSISLSPRDGSTPMSTKGLSADAVSRICDDLKTLTMDGRYNWAGLCVVNRAGVPIRVLSPNSYGIIRPSDFADYWQDYVDRVWDQYAREPLVINTQNSAGLVNCQVRDAQMSCDGDNRPYDKPTARDIWGCDSGPFGKQAGDNSVHLAIIPRLCAAFVRSTLLIAGGNVQPSLLAASYYQQSPTNHYSRLVHEREVDGRGYAFPYDDVNADGENASGTLASGGLSTLTIYLGGQS